MNAKFCIQECSEILDPSASDEEVLICKIFPELSTYAPGTRQYAGNAQVGNRSTALVATFSIYKSPDSPKDEPWLVPLHKSWPSIHN